MADASTKPVRAKHDIGYISNRTLSNIFDADAREDVIDVYRNESK